MTAQTFITIYELAHQTGLPVDWLRREAKAGRIPHVRVGRSLRFNAESAERAIVALAESNCRTAEVSNA